MPARTSLRRGMVLTAALLPGALTGALVVGAAGPAGAVVTACSGKAQDVNGDGFADIAIGEPNGGATGGGRLHVLYGTASGPTATAVGDAPDDQIFAQGIGGVPGSDVKGDFFGSTVAMGDLNGDGCADVAVAQPGNSGRRGAVNVLYGSTTGLTTVRAQTLTQDSVSAGQVKAGEEFGDSIAIADFDGDGRDDMAVGAPFDVPVAGVVGGSVAVFYGSASGINKGTRKAVMITQNSAGIATPAENGDQFGFALAAGDTNNDGFADLAVGSPGENAAAGAVDVLRGSSTGLQTSGAAHWTQDTAGIAGVAQKDDAFGAAVALGDLTGDGRADLVVGVPGQSASRGAVHTILSGAGGPAAAGSQYLTQDTPGVDGVGAAEDRFGFSLAVGDLDGDAFADLAVGTPDDSAGTAAFAGSVSLFTGSATGASTASYGGSRLSQATVGVAGDTEDGDSFGFQVSTAAIDAVGGRENLVVTVPGEDLGGLADVGVVTSFASSPTGPTGVGSRSFEPDTPGLQGVRKAKGFFGWVVD